jgi:hypothetical protein
MLDKIRPSRTTAALVSSQEVSIARRVIYLHHRGAEMGDHSNPVSFGFEGSDS